MTTYKLKIDYLTVDIANSDTLAITLQTQDCRDLSSARRRTISKTLLVYGNDEINKLFASVWDIKYSTAGGLPQTYNHLNRKEAVLYENDEYFLSGAVILKRVLQQSGITSYELIFTTAELFKFNELEKLSLKDLVVFNKYNHPLTHSAVINSWNGNCYVNNVLTDVWQSNPRRPNGSGYFYPLGFYGALTQKASNQYETAITHYFNATKLIPMFFARELFIEVFNKLGITADISSVDDDVFKTLMISGDYDQFKKQLDGYNIDYNATSTVATPYTRSLSNVQVNKVPQMTFVNYNDNLLNIATNETNDDTGSLNNQVYTAVNNGKLTIRAVLSQNVTTNTLQYIEVSQILKVYINDVFVKSVLQQNNFANTGQFTVPFDKTVEIEAKTGEIVRVEYLFSMKIIHPSINEELTAFSTSINSGTATFDFNITSYGYGDTVDIVKWLPNMTANEYVNGIIKLFNLYISEIEQDKIKFLKSSDFYEDYSTQIRLDEYIDHTDEIEVLPIPIETNVKGVKFRYKQPNDFINKAYKDYTGKEWGSGEYLLDTDIATEFIDVNLPFSLVLPNQVDGYDFLVLPCIYDVKNNKYSTVTFAPFLAFYNGMISQQVFLVDYNVGGMQWVTTQNTMYPLITNNFYIAPLTQRLNLCFKYPEYVLYDTNYIPLESTLSVYNVYYEEDLSDLLSPDSKFVRCSISPKALNKQSLLQKLYTIDGVLFRCNKIDGYNQNMRSVKIELIKKIDIKKDKTHLPPLNPSKPIKTDNTTTLKSVSYSLGSGVSGLDINEMFVDVQKRIFGIGGRAFVTGTREEYIGYISQSGTNDPVLQDVYKSFNVEFVRLDVGTYRSTSQGVFIGFVMANSKTDIVKTYNRNNYLHISTDTDGVLNGNIIYIIKVIN